MIEHNVNRANQMIVGLEVLKKVTGIINRLFFIFIRPEFIPKLISKLDHISVLFQIQ